MERDNVLPKGLAAVVANIVNLVTRLGGRDCPCREIATLTKLTRADEESKLALVFVRTSAGVHGEVASCQLVKGRRWLSELRAHWPRRYAALQGFPRLQHVFQCGWQAEMLVAPPR